MTQLERARRELKDRGYLSLATPHVSSVEAFYEVMIRLELKYGPLAQLASHSVTKERAEDLEQVWFESANDQKSGLLWWFHPCQKEKMLLFRLSW